MVIYWNLLVIYWADVAEFYLLKHPANVYQLVLKINITTVFYTLYVTVILRLLYCN